MTGIFGAEGSSGAGSGGAQRPLLMVDIDGVISLFGGSAGATVGAEREGGRLHSVDGMLHFLSATAAAHLLELARLYDLVWASGWEERADEHLPRLLGLPAGLPHLSFSAEAERTSAHWKLEAVERFAADRPTAWIDDCFNDACHAWAAQRAAPTLLVTTDPRRGLTAREARLLDAWARGAGAQGGGTAAVNGPGAQGAGTAAVNGPGAQGAGAAGVNGPGTQSAGTAGVNGAAIASETAAP